MARGSAVPELRRRITCVGVAEGASPLHELLRSTSFLHTPRESRDSVLGANPPGKSDRGGLPRRSRQPRLPTSAHHQRASAEQLASGILFPTYTEATDCEDDQMLHLWILLITTAERRLPRQQQRSATAHHEGADARTSMLDTPELLQSTNQSGHVLRLSKLSVCTSSSAATSSNQDRVARFSASLCRIDVTGCRSLPPAHCHSSLGAKASGLLELLCSALFLTPRPPGRSSHNKLLDRLFSCITPRPIFFPPADTRIPCTFDNTCLCAAAVRAASVACLQDDVVFSRVGNGDAAAALPVIALLAQEGHELGEHLLLGLGLDLLLHRLQRSYICVHCLLANRRSGIGNKVLAAVKLALPLVKHGVELFLGSMARHVENDEEKTMRAVILLYAPDVNQDESDRLNAFTQSLNEEVVEDDGTESSMSTHTQLEERHLRLLSEPLELSFDLCEVPQPCHNYNGGNDGEECCVPIQKDDYPPLKVHALLKYRKKRGSVVQEGNDNDKMTLSPMTTTDKTPPPFRGFFHETDPEEDDGDASIFTTPHSPSIPKMNGVIVYEECVTSGNVVVSVVKTSGKPPIKGMSLKKPTCDTLPVLTCGESDADAELIQLEAGANGGLFVLDLAGDPSILWYYLPPCLGIGALPSSLRGPSAAWGALCALVQ